MRLLQYGLYTARIGAGANGTGVSGATAAAIIGVDGVAAEGATVPGVIEARRRDGAGVRMVVPVVASTEGRTKGKDLLVPASAAADTAPAAISESTRRRVQANGAGQNVPNIVFRQAISETSQPLHWVRSPDT